MIMDSIRATVIVNCYTYLRIWASTESLLELSDFLSSCHICTLLKYVTSNMKQEISASKVKKYVMVSFVKVNSFLSYIIQFSFLIF